MAASAPPAPAYVTAPAGGTATVGPPWSIGRALARAGIGAVLAVLFQTFWLGAANPWLFEDPSLVDKVAANFGAVLVYFVVGAVVLSGVLESAVPALRIPSGSAWRAVGRNRWIVALIVGTAMGLIVGVIAEVIVLQSDFATIEGTGLEIVAFAALGWLLGEAAVGRRGSGASKAAA
jgi:hypothetical protein